ncbi:MAG: hypothetical protein KBD56_09890 [Candidatus Eisenbacteria bacterium]|nr:hypothetical protein [Candidatus Eisenbacteria bacterium]
MKRIACLSMVIGLLAPVAGLAGANQLDRAGTWSSSQFHQATGPMEKSREVINDGSFELGPPPASAWTEVSNSPNCEWIGDFASAWYCSSWDGYFDYWAGGYCTDDLGNLFAVTSSVSQTIHIPAETTTLSFFYVSYRSELDDDPPDGDHVYVSVNGVEVWTMEMLRANNSYPEWIGPVLVDLAAYAGQDILLSFGGVSVGDVTGNVRFDYIELIPGSTPVEGSAWGSIKALYR